MKKVLVTFWIPKEVAGEYSQEIELIYPQEEITGQYSMEEIKSMLPEVDAVLIGMERFTKEIIDLGKNLKAIGRLGVGCDNVDYEYAGQKGIAVINTPSSVTQPTAELTIAILLSVARCIPSLDKRVRKNKRCIATPSYEKKSTNVFGKVLGIIGFGRIGKAVAEKAKGLGMEVIYSDIVKAPKEVEEAIGAKKVTTEELLKTADFVSLHCPYVPENHHLINKDTLALMKEGAYLINASRGKIVDEAALVEALKNKKIKGAALDVYEFEPEISEELLEMENVVLVPHVGTWTYDARVAMAKESLDGICAILRGNIPTNIFNKNYLIINK